MRVDEAMSRVVLTVGPAHTLREAARAMAARGVGAAVVMDPEAPGPGILTERDVLRAVGNGRDPDVERVEDHLTSELVVAGPAWSLDDAARAMVDGGFRHLLVIDSEDTLGIISVRDIVRSWTSEGAGEMSRRFAATT